MRVALLANPAAGRGQARQLVDAVVGRLHTAGADVDLLEATSAEQAETLSRAAVAEGLDTLVVLGGDGMVHLAVQALAGQSATALAVVPLGSGNDFARSLRLPTEPYSAATRAVTGTRRAIDLARSGDRWYATILTAGFDAIVTARGNRLPAALGAMRYTAAMGLELPRFEPLSYTLVLDDEERRLDAVIVAVANTDFYGGGMQIAAGAQPDDGMLDVVIVHPLSRLELLRFFPTVRTGTHVTNPRWERLRARTVTVAASGITTYADGERFADLPLTVECVPGALTVVV